MKILTCMYKIFEKRKMWCFENNYNFITYIILKDIFFQNESSIYLLLSYLLFQLFHLYLNINCEYTLPNISKRTHISKNILNAIFAYMCSFYIVSNNDKYGIYIFFKIYWIYFFSSMHDIVSKSHPKDIALL